MADASARPFDGWEFELKEFAQYSFDRLPVINDLSISYSDRRPFVHELVSQVVVVSHFIEKRLRQTDVRCDFVDHQVP